MASSRVCVCLCVFLCCQAKNIYVALGVECLFHVAGSPRPVCVELAATLTQRMRTVAAEPHDRLDHGNAGEAGASAVTVTGAAAEAAAEAVAHDAGFRIVELNEMPKVCVGGAGGPSLPLRLGPHL